MKNVKMNLISTVNVSSTISYDSITPCHIEHIPSISTYSDDIEYSEDNIKLS